jgi:hypothetical protein
MDVNFGLGRPMFPAASPRALFEFKLKVDEKRRTLMKFD